MSEQKPIRQLWKKCVPWNDTTPGQNDAWCAHDFGQGFRHVDQVPDNCQPGFGKGVCEAPVQAPIEAQVQVHSKGPMPPTDSFVPMNKDLLWCADGICRYKGSELMSIQVGGNIKQDVRNMISQHPAIESLRRDIQKLNDRIDRISTRTLK